MSCRMLSTVGCIGLNDTYCKGLYEGMKVIMDNAKVELARRGII